MRLLKVLALVTTVAAAATAAAYAEPDRNLEAILRPAAGGPADGFGLVKFRQPKDDATRVELDVWVRDLLPDASYRLQRATDLEVDDSCDGTNWLTLGQGLASAPIETDDRGTGRVALFRDLPLASVGTPFDIHFRVIDANDVVVLESGCYQFTASL